MSTASVQFRFIRTAAGARLVYAILAMTMLVSPIAFIEPSPYEGMVFVLMAVAFATGLTFERQILPLLALLTIWAASGFLSLLPAFGDSRAVMYYAISVYLMTTTVLFACLFAEDATGRIAALANAYLVAAIGVSLIGIAAFFGAIPNADSFLANGRVSSTFKDPNVFGPYLVLPLLMLLQRAVYQRIRLMYVAAAAILLLALFLTFSRGAWGHFVLSAIVMVALLLITEKSGRFRHRLVVLAMVAAIGVSLFIPAALTLEPIREMFNIRAELLQSYDTGGSGGRFGRQSEAITAILEAPNGLGPVQFAVRHGQDVHNVYFNAFLAYGWAGGLAYLALVILTLNRGLAAILTDSPWRPFLVAAYATFVGVAAEGMIVDTDHWRQFFLVIGLVWGLSAATDKYRAGTGAPTSAPITGRPAVAVPSAEPVERSRVFPVRTGHEGSFPRQPAIERARKTPI